MLLYQISFLSKKSSLIKFKKIVVIGLVKYLPQSYDYLIMPNTCSEGLRDVAKLTGHIIKGHSLLCRIESENNNYHIALISRHINSLKLDFLNDLQKSHTKSIGFDLIDSWFSSQLPKSVQDFLSTGVVGQGYIDEISRYTLYLWDPSSPRFISTPAKPGAIKPKEIFSSKVKTIKKSISNWDEFEESFKYYRTMLMFENVLYYVTI
jgi:hypothetical protein